MEEKKSVKLKRKVDWKRVVKLSLISVALLLLVVLNVVSAVGGRDERADSGVVAYADNETISDLYYLHIPQGTTFFFEDDGTNNYLLDDLNGDDIEYIELGLEESDYYYSYIRNIYSPYDTYEYPDSSYFNFFVVDEYVNADEGIQATLQRDLWIITTGALLQDMGYFDGSNSYEIGTMYITYLFRRSGDTYVKYEVPVYGLLTAGESQVWLPFNDGGYDAGYNAGLNANISALTPVKMFLAPVQAFFDIELFGIMSLGDVLSVGIFVAVAIIFLKMFSGG